MKKTMNETKTTLNRIDLFLRAICFVVAVTTLCFPVFIMRAILVILAVAFAFRRFTIENFIMPAISEYNAEMIKVDSDEDDEEIYETVEVEAHLVSDEDEEEPATTADIAKELAKEFAEELSADDHDETITDEDDEDDEEDEEDEECDCEECEDEDEDEEREAISFNPFKDGCEIIFPQNVTYSLDDLIVKGPVEELDSLVDYCLNPDHYEPSLYTPDTRVLLSGPAGFGKTSLVKAFAKTVDLPILRVHASRFYTNDNLFAKLFELAEHDVAYILEIDAFDLLSGENAVNMAPGSFIETLKTYLEIFDNVIFFAVTDDGGSLDEQTLHFFKKSIELDLPNLEERRALLREFANIVGYDFEVNFDPIAKNCIGFSIGEIKTLIGNSINIARKNKRKTISQADLLSAWDTMLLGSSNSGHSTEKARKLVAYHEAGHAVISYVLSGKESVFRVISIGHGNAGGVTIPTSDENVLIQTEEDLKNEICMTYGGRAAEKLVFGHVSTGASSDIKQATSLIMSMVRTYGMSDEIGPLNVCPKIAMVSVINESNDMQNLITRECIRISKECDQRALDILTTNRDKLEALAEYLISHESITGDEMVELFDALE